MRKRWMLVSLLVAGPAAGAQDAPRRIGVYGGMNQAHMDGSSTQNMSNRTAGFVGAYFVAPVETKWSWQAGAMYSMKGWKRVEPGTGDFSILKLDYAEIPVLLRYDFGTFDRTGVFAFGGPGVAFRTGCAIEIGSGSGGGSTTASCSELDAAFPGSADFKSYDLGVILGAGLRFSVGRRQLLVLGQYDHGLTSIQAGEESKNRVLSLGVGVELPFPR